jgi:TPR repeat protein
MSIYPEGIQVEIQGRVRGCVWPFLLHRIKELSVDVENLELQLGIDSAYEGLWLESYAEKFDAFSDLPLREQADSGEPIAAADYGLVLCESGEQLGLKYLNFSATNGVPHAAVNLGFYYLHGLGCAERNLEEAFRWSQIGAKQGCPEGAANLGFQYEQGLGTAKDKKLAELWYVYSAIRGSDSGYGALLALRKFKDEINDVLLAIKRRLH